MEFKELRETFWGSGDRYFRYESQREIHTTKRRTTTPCVCSSDAKPLPVVAAPICPSQLASMWEPGFSPVRVGPGSTLARSSSSVVPAARVDLYVVRDRKRF